MLALIVARVWFGWKEKAVSLSAEATTLPSCRGRFSLYLPRLKLRSRGGRVLFVAAVAAEVLPAVEERALLSMYSYLSSTCAVKATGGCIPHSAPMGLLFPGWLRGDAAVAEPSMVQGVGAAATACLPCFCDFPGVVRVR